MWATLSHTLGTLIVYTVWYTTRYAKYHLQSNFISFLCCISQFIKLAYTYIYTCWKFWCWVAKFFICQYTIYFGNTELKYPPDIFVRLLKLLRWCFLEFESGSCTFFTLNPQIKKGEMNKSQSNKSQSNNSM